MNSEFDIFRDELYKNFGLDFEEAVDKHIEIFFKDRFNYSHQCELRAIINTEHLKSIRQGKKKQINGLSYINVNENKPVNATGKDMICYTKSTSNGLYGTVILERKI